MSPGPSLQIACPAKVNLTLAVGKPDPSDPKRRHPIASRMLAIDLCDQLTLSRLDFGVCKSRFKIAFAEDVAFKRRIDWPLEHDLTYRAHALLQTQAGQALPVDASLVKRIPTEAGMGGGSSDAAAMLVGLNGLFELGFSFDNLSHLGEQLGSDVPFALSAILRSPAADVTGFGERVQAISAETPTHLTLVVPDFVCPTAAVFQKYDALGLGRGTVAAATLDPPITAAKLFNDLTPAAAEAEPQLAKLMRRLRSELGLVPHLTGSGSTCFIVQPDPVTSQQTAATIHSHISVHAIPVTTLVKPARGNA